jgi:hypothetical protein
VLFLVLLIGCPQGGPSNRSGIATQSAVTTEVASATGSTNLQGDAYREIDRVAVARVTSAIVSWAPTGRIDIEALMAEQHASPQELLEGSVDLLDSQILLRNTDTLEFQRVTLWYRGKRYLGAYGGIAVLARTIALLLVTGECGLMVPHEHVREFVREGYRLTSIVDDTLRSEAVEAALLGDETSFVAGCLALKGRSTKVRLEKLRTGSSLRVEGNFVERIGLEGTVITIDSEGAKVEFGS